MTRRFIVGRLGYLSSAFSWTYALMQMPAGVLLDRWGVRRVGRLSALLWSVPPSLPLWPPALSWFFGAAPPPGRQRISHVSPPMPRPWLLVHARGKRSGNGDHRCGSEILHRHRSSVDRPAAPVFGWRWSFAATGFISFLYFVLFSFVYRNPSEDKKLSAQELEFVPAWRGSNPKIERDHKAAVRSGYLLTQPRSTDLPWDGALITILFSTFDLAAQLSFRFTSRGLVPLNLYTSVPWLFATATDLLVGGWLVDFPDQACTTRTGFVRRPWWPEWLRSRDLRRGSGSHCRRRAGLDQPCASGLAAAAPVAWTIPSLIAPRESVGTLAGAVNLCGQIAAISAPIATGYIVSASHSFAAAFVTATVILLMGIAGYISCWDGSSRFRSHDSKENDSNGE